MYVFKEDKEQLDEMSLRVVSSRTDNLPFRIVIQSPDHQPPHVHIRDLATGKKKLGRFLLSGSPPKRPEDIEDYEEGIPDEWRGLICSWAKKPHKAFPKMTNWEALCLDWSRNEDF